MSKLNVGAAKVCITPTKDMMPAYSQFPQVVFEGVYQDLYARALIIDNGEHKLALLTYDSGDMSRTDDIKAALQNAYSLQPEWICFSVTHTHEAPTFANEHRDVGNEKEKLSWALKYGDFIINQSISCVGKALNNMREAHYGFGTGKSYINVCRDQRFENGEWGQGRDFEGPSDKTLAILKLIDDEGNIIAALLNYAVHGTACFMKQDERNEKFLISGDVPGMVSAYLEERYQEHGAVFLWTSGAAGNQNPIFFTQYLRYNHNKTAEKFFDPGYAAWGLCEHMAQTQAIDAIRVLNGIDRFKDSMHISVVDRAVPLPGQKIVRNLEGSLPETDDFSIESSENVILLLKLVTIDDIAMLGMNGELVAEIGLRLKEKSPLKNLIIITHTAERIGYLPDKVGYDNRTFAFFASLVKDGCTEKYLTDAMLEMFQERFNKK